MIIFSNLISLHGKLIAYNFLGNSGISQTAANAGYSSQTSITSIVGVVISALLGLLGVIFLGLIIYGGIMWMTAEGEEERVEKAKNIIVESIIGLVIVLAAYAISFFVISTLAK